MLIQLDRTFANEVKKTVNGDGTREYCIAMISELKKVSAALGNRYNFDACVKEYGRAKVGICVATTILYNRNRHETPQITWALAVAELWTNKNSRSTGAATINIHPAILSDNSHSLRQVTTV